MAYSQSDDLRLTFSYLQPLLSQVWRLEFQKTHSAELRLYLHININIQYDNKLWKTCSDPELNHQGQGWEFAHSFSERIERFSKKWANVLFAQKNTQFANSLIFVEQPERFAHGCSFLVSNLSESLTVAHFWWATWAVRSNCSLNKREWANRSFLKTYESLTVALLSWATWAICSRSLFWHKRSERFAHSRSLSWAIWANHSQSLIWSERMSYEQMSEFPTLIRDRSVG